MRYDVKKFLFIGLESEKDLFFKRAQNAGIIHFINASLKENKDQDPRIQNFAESIKILRTLPVVEQEESDDFSLADDMVDRIVKLKEKLNELAEQERIVNLEMSRVAVFGSFSQEDITFIEQEGNRKIQFYCAKQGFADTHELPPDVVFVGSDNGLDYFVAINKQPTQYPNMIEMIIEEPYNVLKKRYNEIEREIHLNEKSLKGYSKYNKFLHQAFIHELNTSNLENTKNFVQYPLDQESLFAIQGWVPSHKLEALKRLVAEMKIFVDEIDLDAKDTTPTYLENHGFSRIGEDLVQIYDTPSHNDRDPSLWVLFFFALFFSMVINDGGYGLILLLIALYIRYKHSNLYGVKKRVLDLLTILGFSCIVWGVLTTSFFGITIAPDNPVQQVSLMSWLVEKKAEYHIQRHDEVYKEWITKFPQLESVKDPREFLTKASSVNSHDNRVYEAYAKFSDNIMLELALFVGVIHIIISMGRYLDRNWSHIGWILFLIGAYLYLPTFLGAASILNFAAGINKEQAAKNGLYLIYGGIIIAVVLAVFKHKFLGLLEASVVIQIFGDVLSYLRLYALGLAGSLLTATMMDLAASVPFVIGLLILLVGHLVNIVLGIMSGIIHGLRLNFLEWYHYCFEGGGKMFAPLKKIEIE